MFNSNRVIRVFVMVMVLVSAIAVPAVQAEIVPYANPVFAEASVYLSSSMVADFTASARLICPSITVTSCTLQRKVNGTLGQRGLFDTPRNHCLQYFRLWGTERLFGQLHKGLLLSYLCGVFCPWGNGVPIFK